MLPSLLTTDICSLVQHEDRYTFSVLWEFHPTTLEMVGKPTFHKTVIRSRASLTYAQAQTMIDFPNTSSFSSSIESSVRLLSDISICLRKKRIEKGALSLASQEVKFELQGEEKKPVDVKEYDHTSSHELVEEFMLLANVAVAEKIEQVYPKRALLRRHPNPSKEMLDDLIACAKCVGVTLDVSSSKALAVSLDNATRPDQPFFNQLLRIMTTRAMQQAKYFCTGNFANKTDYFHYGLAVELYTHFTSPIRRYADVIAHRLLAAACGI